MAAHQSPIIKEPGHPAADTLADLFARRRAGIDGLIIRLTGPHAIGTNPHACNPSFRFVSPWNALCQTFHRLSTGLGIECETDCNAADPLAGARVTPARVEQHPCQPTSGLTLSSFTPTQSGQLWGAGGKLPCAKFLYKAPSDLLETLGNVRPLL
jgi:hypothetical protein